LPEFFHERLELKQLVEFFVVFEQSFSRGQSQVCLQFFHVTARFEGVTPFWPGVWRANIIALSHAS
jgi:hypothetical protein